MMSKEKVDKAEYPLNTLGLGYNSTLENAPFLFTEVDYLPPEDNYRYQFCGACPFYRSPGVCVALQREVHILASCKLYLSMEHELTLRHNAFMLRHSQEETREQTKKSSEEDLEVKQEVEKYIEERDGKYCVISHRTGKSLGCYDTKDEAEAALDRMKRFRKDLVVKIASTDEEKRVVVGIVMEPDEVDAHEDTVTAEEIEKAAYNYALSPMVIGKGHMEEAKAKPVETYIYDPDVLKNVKPGSWVMAVKINDDELWEGIKSGEFTGFSIGAMAKRIPVLDNLDGE